MPDTYDLIVLGSGPGGYVAAIRGERSLASRWRSSSASCSAASVSIGGASRPRRCCARPRSIHYMQHAKDYGLVAEKISADLEAVVKRSRGVAKQLNQGVTHLMKKNKIAVHMGNGKLAR